MLIVTQAISIADVPALEGLDWTASPAAQTTLSERVRRALRE
ncbi:hypothetical protein OV203_25870 [Nannocystis sp. ILAH1]|nr:MULTISPECIES: hypothetical protein [unclassified Nannocystis]MCY0990597.1 hypothetical protein [Nannocystis sp. ILAH1]MCY1072168.1 hypothetical protein [Nannocystis sp. RBIL2]